MNQESGKGIIFGVLGILTLIIAIMGASLAYFTATAMDTDPEKIIVQAATVTISYDNGRNLEARDLIPTSFAAAEWAYNRGIEKDNAGRKLPALSFLYMEVANKQYYSIRIFLASGITCCAFGRDSSRTPS